MDSNFSEQHLYYDYRSLVTPEEPVKLAYPKWGYLRVVVEIESLVPWQNLTYVVSMVIEY